MTAYRLPNHPCRRQAPGHILAGEANEAGDLQGERVQGGGLLQQHRRRSQRSPLC